MDAEMVRAPAEKRALWAIVPATAENRALRAIVRPSAEEHARRVNRSRYGGGTRAPCQSFALRRRKTRMDADMVRAPAAQHARYGGEKRAWTRKWFGLRRRKTRMDADMVWATAEKHAHGRGNGSGSGRPTRAPNTLRQPHVNEGERVRMRVDQCVVRR
jgi:hypothetical protein